MAVLLHLSDTHFGTERAPVVEALVRLSRRLRPDLVVLSGDVTQRARAHQFRAARAFTDRLGAPLVAIPGNHDIPLFNLAARCLHPWAGQRRAFGDVLEPVHASDELLVVCVNTTRPWRHKHGEVSGAQIERTAARLLQAQARQLRVVVVHQPVAVLRASERGHRLRGGEAALRRWAQAGCDLVLGGHIHLPYVAALTGLARPMWVVQAGTAVSRRTRDGIPNSVNVLRWDGSAHTPLCHIERWDHDARSGEFVQARARAVQPRRTVP